MEDGWKEPAGPQVGRGHGGVQKKERETGLQTLTWVPGPEKETEEQQVEKCPEFRKLSAAQQNPRTLGPTQNTRKTVTRDGSCAPSGSACTSHSPLVRHRTSGSTASDSVANRWSVRADLAHTVKENAEPEFQTLQTIVKKAANRSQAHAVLGCQDAQVGHRPVH